MRRDLAESRIDPDAPGSVAPDDDVPRGAVAVIRDTDGQLLLHLRDDIPGIVWPGYWSVLGGGCDSGEHPDDAIVRELDEEAGLQVDDLAPVLEILDSTGSGQLLTVYTGTWTGDPTTLPLSEGQELRFIPPGDLAGLLVPPHIRAVLDRVLHAA